VGRHCKEVLCKKHVVQLFTCERFFTSVPRLLPKATLCASLRLVKIPVSVLREVIGPKLGSLSSRPIVTEVRSQPFVVMVVLVGLVATFHCWGIGDQQIALA
jgi:hypothetical protein